MQPTNWKSFFVAMFALVSFLILSVYLAVTTQLGFAASALFAVHGLMLVLLIAVLRREPVPDKQLAQTALLSVQSPQSDASNLIVSVESSEEITGATASEQTARRVVKSLSATTRESRNFIECMPVGMLTLDSSGNIRSANLRAMLIFRTTIAKLKRKNVTEFIQLVNSQSGDSLSFEQFTNVALDSLIEARAKSFDPAQPLVPIDLAMGVLEVDRDNGFVLSLTDVSHRYEIEQLRQDFVSIVSHDLQTPLTSIKACLTLLKAQESMSPTALNSLVLAERESDRLIRLTRDLLELAKAEAGKIVLNRMPTSSAAIAEESIATVITLAEKKEIEIVDCSIDELINVDPDKILQILVNLLSNAIKYSDPGTQVKLVVAKLAQGIKFSVIDQGRGIPASDLPHVFDRFQQVYEQDARRGTGLGLAICKLLAEAHGGSVGVESVQGGGSTFWLILPVGELH
ncbi:MAG: hypothetical protein K2W95_35730 [Candidatus Obscuribacterales bacterium]|nr:hypothetical protein [Candidatus Obscuribacterales bacterium]